MNNDLRNNLVLAKIEKAREALDEAVWCYEGEKYPAAVNRLYFSIYRACLALLVGEEKVPVKHTAVIGLVNKKFVKENLLPREVGRFLHEIQTARIEGDYKDSFTSTPPIYSLDAHVLFPFYFTKLQGITPELPDPHYSSSWVTGGRFICHILVHIKYDKMYVPAPLLFKFTMTKRSIATSN